MTRTHYAGTREGGLLDGMRVVDDTEGIAGAYAAKLLADQGASVTKIERAGGDPLRPVHLSSGAGADQNAAPAAANSPA